MDNALTEQQKFDEILACAKHFAPGFKVSLKSESGFHKLIGKILAKVGNMDYMQSYWTTIGQWCARPSMCDKGVVEGEWRILGHEIRHAQDCAKIGSIPFAFIYLFPQILALVALALLAIVWLGGPTYLLWGLLGLIGILPLPAIGRAYIEYRAFIVTLAIHYWSGDTKNNEDYYINAPIKLFTTGAYYWMFPFKGLLTKIFKGKLQELKTGTFELDPYLAFIKTKCFQWKK